MITSMQTQTYAKSIGMYDPRFEHDSCGIGAVVNIKGVKTHATVENALKIVENLQHRAGKDAEGKTGDGVGILLQISYRFLPKRAGRLGLSWAESGNLASACSFFRRMNLSAAVR